MRKKYLQDCESMVYFKDLHDWYLLSNYMLHDSFATTCYPLSSFDLGMKLYFVTSDINLQFLPLLNPKPTFNFVLGKHTKNIYANA